MGKKLQKKKRGQVQNQNSKIRFQKTFPHKKNSLIDYANQNSFYNRPLTRADTIGHIMCDYELDKNFKENSHIPEALIGRPFKTRKILTRKEIGFLQAKTDQKLVKCEDRTFQLAYKSYSDSGNNISVQHKELGNTVKSNNFYSSSFNTLNNHSFQDTYFYKPESAVNMQLSNSPERNNRIHLEGKISNPNSLSSPLRNSSKNSNTVNLNSPVDEQFVFSQCAVQLTNDFVENDKFKKITPESESEMKLNNAHFYRLNPLNDLSVQDIFNTNVPSYKQLGDYEENKSQNTEQNNGFNFNAHAAESEKSGENNIFLDNLSKCNINNYILIPDYTHDKQLVDYQEQPMNKPNEGTNCNISASEPETNINYISTLSSSNSNLQQDKSINHHVPVQEQQVHPQDDIQQITAYKRDINYSMLVPERKNVESSNIVSLHGSNGFNNSSHLAMSSICTFKAQPVLKKGSTLNEWMETVIDSVAARVLPYIP